MDFQVETSISHLPKHHLLVGLKGHETYNCVSLTLEMLQTKFGITNHKRSTDRHRSPNCFSFITKNDDYGIDCINYFVHREMNLKLFFFTSLEMFFICSPEPEAQVSFSDQNVSVVRRRCRCCRRRCCHCCCCRKGFIFSSPSPEPQSQF